jgi:hypothetical protein
MIDDKMNDSQRKELTWYLRAYTLYFLGTILVGGYVVLSAALQVPENSNALIGLGIFAPITCGICVWSAYKAWQISLDLSDEGIENIEGIIYIKETITGNKRQARIQIGDLYFYFDRAKLPNLKHEKPYRLYYSPRSKIYLGADPLF